MTDDDNDLLQQLGRALRRPVPPLDPARMDEVQVRAAAGAALAGSPRPKAAGPAQPSRRHLLWMGAAAAGGIAAGATGAALVTDDGDVPVGPPTESVASLATATGVDAEARLIDHTWGLEVLLDVSGLQPGTLYAMTFIGRDARRSGAGGFVGTDGLMRCRNNGAVLRDQVVRFEVTDPSGAAVVTGDLA